MARDEVDVSRPGYIDSLRARSANGILSLFVDGIHQSVHCDTPSLCQILPVTAIVLECPSNTVTLIGRDVLEMGISSPIDLRVGIS